MNIRRNKVMIIILIAIYIVLTVSGLVLMKKGANSGTITIQNGELNFGINLISLAGFLCYICSFLLFTKIIIMFDLSYIMPICTGIVQIFTLIASYVVFKEQMSKQGIIGVCLVIIGIIIMSIKNK